MEFKANTTKIYTGRM